MVHLIASLGCLSRANSIQMLPLWILRQYDDLRLANVLVLNPIDFSPLNLDHVQDAVFHLAYCTLFFSTKTLHESGMWNEVCHQLWPTVVTSCPISCRSAIRWDILFFEPQRCITKMAFCQFRSRSYTFEPFILNLRKNHTNTRTESCHTAR